jgi:8-amino-7-oxononanoate synthase
MLDRMSQDLAASRAAGQHRDLAIQAGVQLNSNDYLGLSTHPRLKAAIRRALDEDDRVCSTGSRLLSGNHERWEQLEADFANFAGAEAALYFPSGYAAIIGLLSSVLKPGDTVFSDAANHASLIDGIRLSRAKKLIFPHLDLNHLEDAMQRETSNAGERIVVVESIFSMEGDRAPVDQLIALCNRYDAWLIVDEAHSTGVDDPVRRADRLLATVNTCGKALASMGAFVTGSQTLRDFLINRARTFIYTTALPPYCAAHVHEATILAAEADAAREHLMHLSRYLRERMHALGFDTGRSDSQIIPLLLGSNETALRVASALSSSGFAIRAIRPPTVPVGTSRIRMSLNANLSIADMDSLLAALVAAREILGGHRPPLQLGVRDCRGAL